MMAVTVERALAFPLRDSWVPCRDGGIKHKEQKQLWGAWPAYPRVRPMSQAAISMCQTQPRTGRPNSNAACSQIMAKPGWPTVGRNSQGICHQIFPLCLCSEGDAAKLEHSHVAKVKKQQEKPLCLREGAERSTRGDSSALLHWAKEALANKGKVQKIPAKHPSGKEGTACGCARAAWWGLRCTSYQICRHRCCDERVGPIHQSTTDDQHRCRGTREEIKSLGAGSSRTWDPSSPACVWTLLTHASTSCASPFPHGDPSQQAVNTHPTPPPPKFSLGAWLKGRNKGR